MKINIKLDPDFSYELTKLKSVYGEEFAKLNGLADEQLDYTDFIDRWKGKVISGIVFAFIGIGNGLYVYIKTKINHKDWWIPYIIKKGYFSCLLLLFWYYVCYDIYYIRFWTKYMDPDIDPDEKMR